MNRGHSKKETQEMKFAVKSPRARYRLGALLAFAVVAALGVGASPVQGAPEDFGLGSVGGGVTTTQAGAHPDVTTFFDLKRDPATGNSYTDVEDIAVELPAGVLGNAQQFPTCPTATFVESGFALVNPSAEQCQLDTQVGLVNVSIDLFGTPLTFPEPLFNLTPTADEPGRLGFVAAFAPVVIDIEVRSDEDYGLTAATSGALGLAPVNAVETIAWGVPADSSHDAQRFTPIEVIQCFGPCSGPQPSPLPPTPFMTNPTSCLPGKVFGYDVTAYQLPGQHFTDTAPLPDIDGCENVPFEPDLTMAPTTTSAASAAGIDFEMTVPQDGLLDPNGLGSAHLKKAVITLPQGVSLNASAADGLGSCSQAQMGVTSVSPLRFNKADPTCPQSSKVGDGEIVTPLLAEPLKANLYLAKQDDNPFDSLLAGYLVAKGSGVIVKVGGSFDLDPSTGRIVATFDGNPEQPFSSLALHFKSGNRGVITTPSRCGTYAVDYELTPWSGNEPVRDSTSFTIDQNCDASGRFAPGFHAGSANALAGAFSTFVTQITRDPGTPQLTGITVEPPQGLTGKLAGIPYCPDAALAGISGEIGTGAAQLSSPSCPTASQVGTVIAGAGSGNPFYVNTGKVYLAGPYKGAPLSLAIVTPAVAGPFDLGNVVVRTALNIDPVTAQLRATSDGLPTILHGIPLDLRDVRVLVDRQDFAINPTSCERKAAKGTITGSGGASANVTDRYQVGECAALGFKPKLGLKLKGGTTRGKHPALTAVLRPRTGDANISSVSVAFPHAEFLDQSHIGTVCTRVQWAADQCPAASVYGTVTATSPLLDNPLTGNVYLRSSDHKLPDLVTDLRGPASQPIRFEAAGRNDSVNRGLRNSFEFVPDAPISKVVLRMRGGKKGLLQNSTNLCAHKYAAKVSFTAHNGRALQTQVPLQTSCKGPKGKKAKRQSRSRG